MLEYRVTKYNPAFRDSSGAYKRHEWTSFGDIGRSFDGIVLTTESYQQIEDAYVSVAIGFLRESGKSSLKVEGLENRRKHPIKFGEDSILTLPQLESVIPLILREKFWCRLEGQDGFLHFGWDYYMYVGVPYPCPGSQGLARRSGLFVEEIPSPYNYEGEGA